MVEIVFLFTTGLIWLLYPGGYHILVASRFVLEGGTKITLNKATWFVPYPPVFRTWLIDSKGIARKVKNASQISNYQIKNWVAEANRQCPKCNHRIDNSDVSPEWPGLPIGVKFDPSDLEILEHLAGKVGLENSKPHLLIDEFIPTIEGEEGICYTHPENLPGAKKDGSSIHFFHRTAKAYTTGHRKRRKIHKQDNLSGEHVRWHKTGKTRPIFDNNIQKGWKKIMVLYKSSKKASKPDKSNWVMHQYHLGITEDEEEGGLVVSKVFYQQHQNQSEKNDVDLVNQEADVSTSKTSPRTPKTNAPHPPRSEKNSLYEDAEEEKQQHLPGQVSEQDAAEMEYERVNSAWLAGESQATEDLDPGDIDNWLLCNEILDPSLPFQDLGSDHFPCFLDTERDNVIVEDIANNSYVGNHVLENLEFETPPDLDLADLQFGSQDSIMGWLDRL